MMYDTDILIWIQRGNLKAAKLLESDHERSLSIQSYMELLQGASDKTQHRHAKDFICKFDIQVLPFSENIGHRALVYVEEFSLSAGMRAADAIIAATAVEANLELCTSNARHFRVVNELKLKVFKP
jgi:predicted nucleic acid-binding protein